MVPKTVSEGIFGGAADVYIVSRQTERLPASPSKDFGTSACSRRVQVLPESGLRQVTKLSSCCVGFSSVSRFCLSLGKAALCHLGTQHIPGTIKLLE